MNCEIFVLLEELGFVSEALNRVCSGQLIRSRECTMFRELMGTSPIIWGLFSGAPLISPPRPAISLLGQSTEERQGYCW